MSLQPNDAVIVAAQRTPMAKSKNGGFRNVRADDLSADLIKALASKLPADLLHSTDDLIWGCVNQTL